MVINILTFISRSQPANSFLNRRAIDIEHNSFITIAVPFVILITVILPKEPIQVTLSLCIQCSPLVFSPDTLEHFDPNKFLRFSSIQRSCPSFYDSPRFSFQCCMFLNFSSFSPPFDLMIYMFMCLLNGTKSEQ